LQASTIEGYERCVNKFLEFAQSDKPPIAIFNKFRNLLHERRLSRSTINNYSFAIKCYYKMLGEDISFPFIRPNNQIPYYFNEEEVDGIFRCCTNLKHLDMLKTLFYGCLRASELCNLDDRDVDLKSMVIRIRGGKGGRDGMVYISHDCARTLREYLELRPPHMINGLQPLFYTDFGHRWDRRDVNRMFTYYKKKACIEKPICTYTLWNKGLTELNWFIYPSSLQNFLNFWIIIDR